jgi:hypothetical protein
VPWVAFYVGIALIGLGVLAALTLRLWRQVRQFAHEVSAASQRIATITDELSRISPPRS